MKDRSGKTLSSKEIITKSLGRGDAILLEFSVMILHYIGFLPSHHIRRFFYRLAGMKIGKGTTIHMGTKFYRTENISIGTDTIIGEGVTLDGRGKLSIGNHVDIASEVMIYNAEHNVNDPEFNPIIEEVVIEDYVFIGPRAIILPGIRVGKGAVVGAGAVVTKDVSPNQIVGGVPAKLIGERKVKDHNYKLGRAAWFR